MRLIGAVLFEQNDEWQTSSRYMMVEAFAQIDKEEIDPILSITTKSRLIMTSGHPENYTSLTDATSSQVRIALGSGRDLHCGADTGGAVLNRLLRILEAA